jgi:hypothetical protein
MDMIRSSWSATSRELRECLEHTWHFVALIRAALRVEPHIAAVLDDLQVEAIPLGPLGGSYGGHFRKRASISGEYQGTSGVTYRFMQPSKYAAQHDFFSAAVKHSGFSD